MGGGLLRVALRSVTARQGAFVLGYLRSIDEEQEALVGQSIEQEIIDEAPMLVQYERVVSHSWCERGHIVGQLTIQPGFRLIP